MSAETENSQFRKMTETPVSSPDYEAVRTDGNGMLVANIYNTADTYFVSQEGTSAAGAVGIVFSLMAILQAFGFMCSHGAGSIISRKLGARDPESARKYASTSFYVSILLGLAVEIPGIILWIRLCGSSGVRIRFCLMRRNMRSGSFCQRLLTSSCVMNNILRYEGRAFMR